MYSRVTATDGSLSCICQVLQISMELGPKHVCLPKQPYDCFSCFTMAQGCAQCTKIQRFTMLDNGPDTHKSAVHEGSGSHTVLQWAVVI